MAGSVRFRAGVALATALLLGVTICVATAAPSSARIPAEDIHVSQTLSLQPGGIAYGSSPELPTSARSMTTYIKTPKQEEAEAAVDMLVQLATLNKTGRLLTCSIMALKANAVGQSIGEGGDPAAALAIVKNLSNIASMCFQVVSLLASIGELESPQLMTRASRCAQAAVTVPITTTPEGMSVTGGPVAKKSPLRISCRNAGGDMVVKVKPRAKKASLRSVVGDRLTFGISSAPGTTAAVPVVVGYGNPR
jgi:hypothetical protein